VRLGFALPISGAWATPDNVAALARDAEAHGFRGVWTFQRWLATPDLDGVYQSVLDPMIELGYAAAITSRVRLGLAVVNGPFYAPVALAKQFAALDVLSGGRLDAGVGLGWSEVEYAAAGVPMAARGKRFDEWLDCLDVLLSGSHVSFEGRYYTVPPTRIDPRPVQQPRPPVLIGGNAPAALRRAAVRGDGWISSSRMSLSDVQAAVRTVRDHAAEAGKAPDAMHCVVRGVTVPLDSPDDGADRPMLRGSFDQIRDDLAQYAAAGVDEVFLDLNFDSERVGNPAADPAVGLDLAARLMPLGAEEF
jgi:probable F420-dependent oxidoreductase, Rv2161c family